MNIFLEKIKKRQCSGITNDNKQCKKHILTFSSGIFFCNQHGSTFLSPYHNIIYGYVNEHSYYKFISNKYFSSKYYKKNLIKNRYKKIMTKMMDLNFIKLNKDVITEICKYF
jgi:hypothetical protein